MTKIIKVSKDDINCGYRRDMSKCPVARALKRKFPDSHIRVGYTWIQIDLDSYTLNEEITKRILEYDDYKTIKPFSFDLDSLRKWPKYYLSHSLHEVPHD